MIQIQSFKSKEDELQVGLPNSMKLLDKAADGCHRYGWLINILVMFVMFAYFMGGINESIKAMDTRIGLLERAVFFQTRGLILPPLHGPKS